MLRGALPDVSTPILLAAAVFVLARALSRRAFPVIAGWPALPWSRE